MFHLHFGFEFVKELPPPRIRDSVVLVIGALVVPRFGDDVVNDFHLVIPPHSGMNVTKCFESVVYVRQRFPSAIKEVGEEVLVGEGKCRYEWRCVKVVRNGSEGVWMRIENDQSRIEQSVSPWRIVSKVCWFCETVGMNHRCVCAIGRIPSSIT